MDTFDTEYLKVVIPFFGLGFGLELLIIIVIVLLKRRWIYCLIKTLPRDIRGSIRFLKICISLKWIELQNISLGEMFDKTARKHPEKVSIFFEDQQWTFQDVLELSNRVGNYFLKQGFKKGDNVALFMENCPEFLCIVLGLSKIGVVVPLINSNLKLESLKNSILISKAKAIIFQDELAAAMEGVHELSSLPQTRLFCWGDDNRKSMNTLAAENLKLLVNKEEKSTPCPISPVNFKDVLLLVYTSGTTGLPKPTIFKHARIYMTSVAYHYFNCLHESDIIYTCLPMYHTIALSALSQSIIYGNSVVIRKKFSASLFWKDCINHNVTVAQYIGELCRYLLAQPSKPEDTMHKVRLMCGNGLKPEIWSTFVKRFNIPSLTEFYGSTDGNCNFVNFDNRVGAVGFIPIWCPPFYPPMKLIKLDEETGEPMQDSRTGKFIDCKNNEPGELVAKIVKNSTIHDFPGYANSPASATNKKILRNVFWKGDSAFRSGDYLVRDELGYFYFKDRSGDTFRWKGENCSTAEIESIIAKICNLNDVAVYGVEIPFTDGKAGMATIADPEDSLNIKMISSQISASLPSYATPIFLRIVKSIDTTGTLKIQKVQLQKDGFDIRLIPDPIYIYLNKMYVLLNPDIFDSLLNGDLKL